MSDRLAEVVEDHGGKVLLLARVSRIVVDAGSVRGIELESRHLGRRVVHAPVVISNADLKRTMATLVGPPHLRPATLERVERFEMSPGLAVLYLGIQRDLAREGHSRTNYWVASGYDCEPGYAAVARGQFPADPWVYVSIASVKDPTNPHTAPPGVANLQVMSLAPSTPEAWGVTAEEVRTGAYRRCPAYRERKASYAVALLAAAERAVPRLRDAVVFEEMATPLTHTRYTGSTGGTSYGIALTPEQFLWRRPGSRTEIRGLYLAGASCRTGHGITGVAMSGLMAAANLVGWKLVRDVMGPSNRPAPQARRPVPAAVTGDLHPTFDAGEARPRSTRSGVGASAL